MKENGIFMGTDAQMKATEITDIVSGALLNTATITASIFDDVTRYPVSILAFTSGGVLPIEVGQIIEGATSGATATVGKVSLTAGTWAAGTAAGQLEISGQDGVFQAENLNVTGIQDNIATIPAGDSTCPGGFIDVELLGGGQVKIPMNTVGLLATDFIRIEGSKKYNGQFDIDALDAGGAGWVTITVANNAERLKGTEKVYIGIPAGQDIAIAHGALGDGEYAGVQPDTLEGIQEDLQYFVFEKIVFGAVIVLHRYLLPAGYYSNLKTGV